MPANERQVTHAPHGHILTNVAVWSRDGRRIVYDVRSDPAGELFDGDRIETADVDSGEVRVLYQSAVGQAGSLSHRQTCGVATFSPMADRVVFILGPEDPTPDFSYGPARRRGVMVDENRPGELIALDARDLVPPFTPGALRGGSHVHVFSPDGCRVSFTYEDDALARSPGERNRRNVGMALLNHPVHVSPGNPRNHDGEAFSVLVTRTWDNPRPGTDQISKAFEEAWVGTGKHPWDRLPACPTDDANKGYFRSDGSRQRWAIAFQGHVVTSAGHSISEVFIVDLPDDLCVPGDGPLEGTATTRPRPPRGTNQRRLTFTADQRYPGIQGPRHWVRSSTDGSRIAFLMRDHAGIVQLWIVSPNGGEPVQVTRNEWDINSAFTWSPDGRRIAHVMDSSVCFTEVDADRTTRLTERFPVDIAPRPEACVFSPDGSRIAYVRPMPSGGIVYNQVFVCDVPG